MQHKETNGEYSFALDPKNMDDLIDEKTIGNGLLNYFMLFVIFGFDIRLTYFPFFVLVDYFSFDFSIKDSNLN